MDIPLKILNKTNSKLFFLGDTLGPGVYKDFSLDTEGDYWDELDDLYEKGFISIEGFEGYPSRYQETYQVLSSDQISAGAIRVPAVNSSGQLIAPDGSVLAGSSIKVANMSRNLVSSDNGNTIIDNNSGSVTYTVPINIITRPTMFQQESTGTITVAEGPGVTFIGTNRSTTGAGSLLTLLPTSTANTYIVVKGGL